MVITVFLVLIGLILWVFPDTSLLNYGYAELNTFFDLTPYVLLFLVPAITMRLFTEEFNRGTFETLITRPLTAAQIVWGKYLASIALLLFALLPTLIFVLTTYHLALPKGNIDLAGIAGSYLGLFMLGSVFAAIGIFSSGLAENQIVAFLMGAFLGFFLFEGLHAMAALLENGYYADQLDKLGFFYHYNSMGKGLIDTRDVVYFLSLIVLFLAATQMIIKIRK
jgi:ABC-2 type transport system permease protein